MRYAGDTSCREEASIQAQDANWVHNMQKCMSTGRKCDGYVASRASSPSRYRELSLNVFKAGEEAGAIDFFLRISIDQFSGSSPSEFWNRHVLQLAHQDIGTRHALIALAHLHRDFTSLKNQSSRSRPALNHYDAAIRHHISSLSTGMQDTITSGSAMTTAIIFICIEIMQGHLANAVALLQRSVAMLPAAKGQHVSLYEDLISRLQIHAKRLVNKNIFDSGSSAHTSKEVVSQYKEQDEWRNSCQDLLRDCSAISGNLSIEERVRRVYTMSGTPTNTEDAAPISRETAAYNAVHIRRLLETTSILAEEAQDLSEDKRAVISDSFLPLHRAIVCLAEANLGLTNSDSRNQAPLAPSFALDMGVIGPLYEVARHCRDPILRRKIVDLLRKSNRQEGLLNSSTYAHIVETIIEIEEDGLTDVQSSKDIPLHARISQHSLSFDLQKSKHTISYKPLIGRVNELCHREVLCLD
ncbi:hypothetical protein D6C95_06791 [Aureobasidium pullulans]|nr:hypothetical protein D6C95_06791 [Aureobasidium pullulans]TIA49965.1 hypothetical protein D6C79_03319 [Aureobasidium pullulans]